MRRQDLSKDLSRGSGRDALLDAAANLMDKRGVDQVSLNEITAASGLHNRSAVRYHFGSRDELVREMVARTMTRVVADRTALLDHLESTGQGIDPRQAIEVVVGPLARQLRTPEGRRYLRLCGQLLNHPRYYAEAREALQMNASLARAASHAAPLLMQLPAAIAIERASESISFIVRALADQARLIDSDSPPREPLPEDVFATNLVDVTLAILTATTTTPATT
jgi:AcrR family transcriptional regulator